MELTALEPGVTVAGEKEQLRLFGRPEHVSATGLLKAPDWGVTVTFMLPLSPTGMVIAEGLAPNVSVPLVVLPLLPQAKLNLTAPDISFSMLGLPTACRYAV